jgi:hypothetical protein
MPNHVYSTLRIRGPQADIARLIKTATVKAEKHGKMEKFIKFDRLFPCPCELFEVTSPVRIVSEEEFQKQKTELAERKARIAAGEEKESLFGMSLSISSSYQKELIRRFGVDNWYDWAIKNWGTKWGTYDVAQRESKTGEANFSFQTAWSPAEGLWIKVSADFPTLEFFTEFADEGGGFVGTQTFKEGEKSEDSDPDWSSPEGIQIRKNVGQWSDEEEDEDEESETKDANV